MKAATEFKDKATAPNQHWQTDFTYLKITGWGGFYLSTILNDCPSLARRISFQTYEKNGPHETHGRRSARKIPWRIRPRCIKLLIIFLILGDRTKSSSSRTLSMHPSPGERASLNRRSAASASPLPDRW
jgi:hypothetical protein